MHVGCRARTCPPAPLPARDMMSRCPSINRRSGCAVLSVASSRCSRSSPRRPPRRSPLDSSTGRKAVIARSEVALRGHRSDGHDALELLRDGAERGAVGGIPRRFARARGFHGRARRGGHADRVRGHVGLRQAGHRDPGRGVRRAAGHRQRRRAGSNRARTASRPGRAAATTCSVRRRLVRRLPSSGRWPAAPGGDRQVVRNARRGDRDRQGLHGARRPVRWSRCGAQWHPGQETGVNNAANQALSSFTVEFFGQAAHAAADPWNGRSALHAAELFSHGVNLMREQVKPSARLHYVIQSGGEAPNVVPAYTRIWMYARDIRPRLR